MIVLDGTGRKGQDKQKAEERAQKQTEEGARYQEGQGDKWQEEVIMQETEWMSYVLCVTLRARSLSFLHFH